MVCSAISAVVDDQNCLLLEEISPEAIADALGKLAHDPFLLRTMAANSRVDGRFTLEAMARRLLEMD